jgi:hypothetical protein
VHKALHRIPPDSYRFSASKGPSGTSLATGRPAFAMVISPPAAGDDGKKLVQGTPGDGPRVFAVGEEKIVGNI